MALNGEVGPKLPLFSKIAPPIIQSPDHPGMLTPPLHTLASVPFQWEEEPGKPRPCTALIPHPTNFSELQLPPRLFNMDSASKITKSPSPTTVLDGPYSSSFRSLGEGKGSFCSSGGSPEKKQQLQLSSVVLCKKSRGKRRGIFGFWGKKSVKVRKGVKEEIGDDNAGRKGKIGKLTRNTSFSSFTQAKTRLWDAICEGLKQVMPWKKRKFSKEKCESVNVS